MEYEAEILVGRYNGTTEYKVRLWTDGPGVREGLVSFICSQETWEKLAHPDYTPILEVVAR